MKTQILSTLQFLRNDNLIDLDDPSTITLHKDIIKEKFFLNSIYIEFYKEFANSCKDLPPGDKVEIGSGGGFIKEIIPDVITSDIVSGGGIDVVTSAENLPFKDNSVSAFFLLLVLHHIKNPILFFNEISRCLKKGGKIIVIEPCSSLFADIFYKYFHHETFDKDAGWEIFGNKRLSDANSALPYILFIRDKTTFQKRFPLLAINKMRFHTSFRYLLSGGLRYKQLAPDSMYNFIKNIEVLISLFFSKYLSLLFTVEIIKK